MITIEPITTKEELRPINANICHEGDYILCAKTDNKLSGFIKVCPIDAKAICIQRLTYNDKLSGKQLLIEAVKCAWELGYSVALTSLNDNLLKTVGFQLLNRFDTEINQSKKNTLAYELSYNGVHEYFCSHSSDLNQLAQTFAHDKR